MTQGDFLLRLGIAERAGMLGTGKDAIRQAQIHTAVERLVGDRRGEMGELFKVLAVSSPEVVLAPFGK
jgi:SAM-dependent MidA family methyltransferase